MAGRLSARRQPLERRQLSQALGPERGGDPGPQLVQVQRLGAQPIDHIVLGQAMTTPLFVAGLGAVLAYSHILLDALTEGGVYIGRRRAALAHLRYDNLILNGTFTGLGVLLVFAAFV